MAKKAYIGINNIAKEVIACYVGVPTECAIYEEQIVSKTVDITADNVSDYFTVTNGTYYFAGSGSTFTSNNKAKGSSTASTVFAAKQDIESVSFTYSYSSESNDKFTLTIAGTTVENAVSGATTVKTYNGSLLSGQTIEAKYVKNFYLNSNDDICTLSNMSITYKTNGMVQVGTETRQVARKIKRAYVGVNGIARMWWSDMEPAYVGTAAELSEPRYYLAATSVGDYALFGGGTYDYYGNSASCSVVETYNASLTKTQLSNFEKSLTNQATTKVGDYALFGGGRSGSIYGDVYAYNSYLTQKRCNDLNQRRECLAATSVGDYALFGGGRYSTEISDVDIYNSSLTRTTITKLSVAREKLAATSVGDYALFGGGCSSTGIEEILSDNIYNTVDIYNSSLTRIATTELSIARAALDATTVGKYALFAGGASTTPSGSVATVDAFDSSLTRTTITELSIARTYLAATTVGRYALFGGGSRSGPLANVDIYNSSLTRTTITALSSARTALAATTVGKYALFAGGCDASDTLRNGSGSLSISSYSSTVDVYSVE